MASMSAAVAVVITDAPRSSFCVPCKQRGHVCFAQKMVENEAWCVYCLDDMPCLWEQKQKGATRRKLEKVAGIETEGLMAVEGDEHQSTSDLEKQKKSAGNGHGANGDTRQPERICAVSGCGAALGERNRSGYCQHHFHHSEKQNRHRKNHSEQKVPSPPSSELTLAPGNLKSDRLDHLFLSLPLAEKARIAGAWLTGKI
jgi:hypothetical protein